MTNHLFRFFLVIPVARLNAVRTWVTNNIDPAGALWFAGELSATGAAPATHHEACFASTAQEAKKWMQRLCNLAGIPEPENWDSMNRRQKANWFIDQKAAILAATGIRVLSSDNEGVWARIEDERTTAGLQRL